MTKLPGSTTDGSRQAYLMGAGLMSMGILHFVTPKGFDAIIPDEIPIPRRTLTYASGVAELVDRRGAARSADPTGRRPWLRSHCSWLCSPPT